MTYNTLGRKETMRDPDMGNWVYDYDAGGNLIYQKDGKGQIVRFQYDGLNRMTKRDYPSGTDAVWTYDQTANGYAKGRLTTMTDASGTTKYYYDDPRARTTRKIRTVDGINYSLANVSDLWGQTETLTYPDGEILRYTYHGDGSLYQVGGYATYNGYNALGQPGMVTYGNGVTTRYSYLPTDNRLWTIETSKATKNLLSLEYSYFNNGNIKSILDYLDGTQTQTFTYDALDRLKTAVSTKYGSLSYNYDQIGNFTNKEGISYTYNTNGIRPHAVTATTDGSGYGYDGNGNMTTDGSRTFTWNYDNQPVTIVSGGVATTFKYDGDGVRVKKSSPAGTRIYIDNLYEVSGGVGGNYIYAGDTRVAVKHPGQVLYYHQDHLGSTGVVTGADGLVQEKIFYRPFGESVGDSGLLSVNHKFTGQEFDDETDLYFYNARYYNPKLGRFISADTIVPDPLNPQAFNRYSYVLNNPLRYVDPSGHESTEVTTTFVSGEITDGGYRTVNKDGFFGVTFSWGGSQPGSSDSARGGQGNVASPGGGAASSTFNSAMAFLNDWVPGAQSLKGATSNFSEGNFTLGVIFGVTAVGEGALTVFSGGGSVATSSIVAKGMRAYSVAFETTIAKAGVGTRASHFTDANKALMSAIKEDAAFAKMMDRLGVSVGRLDKSPAGWSWHHIPDQPGMMQLVPRAQHQGGPWQPLLHPEQVGGFKLWGSNY